MTPMLEKIARAIAESYYAADYDAGEAKAWAAKDWEDWLPEARAALLSMREPDGFDSETKLRTNFVIDAILKEGGE